MAAEVIVHYSWTGVRSGWEQGQHVLCALPLISVTSKFQPWTLTIPQPRIAVGEGVEQLKEEGGDTYPYSSPPVCSHHYVPCFSSLICPYIPFQLKTNSVYISPSNILSRLTPEAPPVTPSKKPASLANLLLSKYLSVLPAAIATPQELLWGQSLHVLSQTLWVPGSLREGTGRSPLG